MSTAPDGLGHHCAAPFNDDPAQSKRRVRLASGSALVMLPGMQDTWDHRIPKHDRPCGPRISLTFRGFVA